MLNFTPNNPLLQSIQNSLEAVLLPKFISNEGKLYGQFCNEKHALIINDQIRHEMLNILLSYASQIPHPASANNADDNSNKVSSISGIDQVSLGTLTRWQILAYISGIDLTVAKWFESHLDALSIMHELGYEQIVKSSQSTPALWAVWAAEGHPNPVQYQDGVVTGVKTWCSGANMVDYGLMTYRDEQGRSQLISVDMDQTSIDIDNSGWHAVGMQATDTATLSFNKVKATLIGEPNAYLDRAGFWHGAAGVAACWHGATSRLAHYLLQSYQHKPNDYKAMYLGEISTALSLSQQYFYQVAQLIDSQPSLSHELMIRQLRAQVEQVARQVLETVGMALGAAPFCGDSHFATLSADLTVFIRQSHAAFDLRIIGELASESVEAREGLWPL